MPTPEPDFVVNIMWTLTGTDGTNAAEVSGNTEKAQVEGDDFIPYADLTETQVLGWVQEALGADGIASYQANVDGQINSIVNPPVSPTAEPLPW
tara:strand:+ start:1216 stop:1497 length:282 start_codon:yes stop_codon:yes gene_type:complete